MSEETDGRDKRATLEEFIVACQKSLSRAMRSAQAAARAEHDLSSGERPLYAVEGLQFELKVGAQLIQGENGNSGDRVLLDFDAPADARSTISFRVEPKLIEADDEPTIELANLDVLAEFKPVSRYRIRASDKDGNPMPNRRVSVIFVHPGDTTVQSRIDLDSDILGQIELTIDPLRSSVYSGSQELQVSGLDLGSGLNIFALLEEGGNILARSNIEHAHGRPEGEGDS